MVFKKLTRNFLGSFLGIIIFGVPTAQVGATGQTLRVGIYSGTFDPPHQGHVRVVARAQENLALDLIYVVPNIESPHKKGVTSYVLRKQMSKIAFSRVKGAVLPDEKIEQGFLRADMSGVLEEVMRRHSGSSFFQIMGADSFERYKQVASGQEGITIAVNPRSASDHINERSVGQNHVVELPFDQGPQLSSTQMRGQIAKGVNPPEIEREVFGIVKSYGLYGYLIQCRDLFERKVF